MILAAAALLSLSLRCAPSVAPQTLLALVETESHGNPFALGVNHGAWQPPQPTSRNEALQRAAALRAQGANFDLGLAQINSANLARLGLTLEDAFDPCRNLEAAGKVLRAGYQDALDAQPTPQRALRTALSLYNTGDRQRGFRNGYVARVERSAAAALPLVLSPSSPSTAPSRPQAWDTFGDLSPAAFVTFPISPQGDQP